MIVVEEPGFSCIEDLGRAGLASIGVPRGGAFDEWALRAGNRLVGNDDDAAALEMTLRGPTLRFECDATIAITGAHAHEIHCESFHVRRGEHLSFSRIVEGARAYLCIAGGILSRTIMGSRSISSRLGIGSMLERGDSLECESRVLASRKIAMLRQNVVRVIKGPQWELFESDLAGEFKVSTQADRTGVRLDGPKLSASKHEIDPEPTRAGTIQVPSDGRPIVLGPDGPLTGGYPKIAVVCTADLGVIAQARPGDTLSFELVTIEQARAARRKRFEELDAIS
ncbi:MAG: 5-oxoprolinase subunit C family protein [Actinomycetota bacterium]